MKKFVYVATVLLLLGLAFFAGRFTAPPPQFEAAQNSFDDPLHAAFEDFLRAQRQALELYRQSEFFLDEQMRAEAYRGLLYSTLGAIKAGALQSAEHPRFMRSVDWTSKRGLDNPDNNYYVARISDQAQYRIRGRRGTTADLVFQLVVGEPGVRGAGTSTNVSILEGRELVLDEHGAFEIIVSRDDPGEGVNWLPNGDGARTLLVRYTHSDWSSERDWPLQIERVGMEGEHAPPLSSAALTQGLRDAAASLYDSTATWLEYAVRAWKLMPRNDVSVARETRGGLVGQYSAFGSWELDEDQAIILSVSATQARYQGIELGNLWFVSLDYESRTSSLTLDQLYCPDHDRCHAVIAHRDPGIQNWLDTNGHRRGLIMLRWHGLSEGLSDEQQPRARLVSFGELEQYLPQDVPAFGAADREDQVRRRRAAIQRRFGG